MKIRPLNDRIIVRRKEDEKKTAGGILLPGAVAKEKTGQGVVVSVGDGRLLNTGELYPLRVKPGDTVLFNSAFAQTFKFGDEDLTIIGEGEIYGVLED